MSTTSHNLKTALFDWRDENALVKFNPSVVATLGSCLLLSDEIILRIIDCAQAFKLTTIADLIKETGWREDWAEDLGGSLLSVVHKYWPIPQPLTISEAGSSKKRGTITCSACGGRGHNSKSIFFKFKLYIFHPTLIQVRTTPVLSKCKPSNIVSETMSKKIIIYKTFIQPIEFQAAVPFPSHLLFQLIHQQFRYTTNTSFILLFFNIQLFINTDLPLSPLLPVTQRARYQGFHRHQLPQLHRRGHPNCCRLMIFHSVHVRSSHGAYPKPLHLECYNHLFLLRPNLLIPFACTPLIYRTSASSSVESVVLSCAPSKTSSQTVYVCFYTLQGAATQPRCETFGGLSISLHIYAIKLVNNCKLIYVLS